jgi:hypothetical protein
VPPAKKSSKAAPRKGPSRKQQERAREVRALRNRILTGGVVLVVAGVVIFFAARPESGPSVPDQLKPCRYDERFDGSSRAHVPKPVYEVDPPAGGAHLPVPADPGFYEGRKVPPDGALVHAMEHGFVVLWYRSGLSAEKMSQINDLSDRFGRELIVAERPSLKDEVAITAWHKRALCAQLDPAKVAIFTRAYTDQGPEKGFL